MYVVPNETETYINDILGKLTTEVIFIEAVWRFRTPFSIK